MSSIERIHSDDERQQSRAPFGRVRNDGQCNVDMQRQDRCECMRKACTLETILGTLTTNRMTVVQSYINEHHYEQIPQWNDLDEAMRKPLAQVIALNSAYSSQVCLFAFLLRSLTLLQITPPKEAGGQPIQLGNKTECALLAFLNAMGQSYEELRIQTPEDQFVKVRKKVEFSRNKRFADLYLQQYAQEHDYSNTARRRRLPRYDKRRLGDNSGKVSDFSVFLMRKLLLKMRLHAWCQWSDAVRREETRRYCQDCDRADGGEGLENHSACVQVIHMALSYSMTLSLQRHCVQSIQTTRATVDRVARLER